MWPCCSLLHSTSILRSRRAPWWWGRDSRALRWVQWPLGAWKWNSKWFYSRNFSTRLALCCCLSGQLMRKPWIYEGLLFVTLSRLVPWTGQAWQVNLLILQKDSTSCDQRFLSDSVLLLFWPLDRIVCLNCLGWRQLSGWTSMWYQKVNQDRANVNMDLIQRLC